MRDSSYPQPYVSGLSVRGAARISEAKRFPGQLREAPNGTFGDHSDMCPNAVPAASASRGRASIPFLKNMTFPPPQLKRHRPCDDQSLKAQVSSLGNTAVFKQSIHRLARDTGLLHPGLRLESSPESPPGKSGPQDAVMLGAGTGAEQSRRRGPGAPTTASPSLTQTKMQAAETPSSQETEAGTEQRGRKHHWRSGGGGA